ncbi:Hypothetical protein MCYN_0403 [Mycoplasmopsis cynos C142]|uniref:Uncharacterized protein n=1 Tax=Mycoplasmopsis cynos (strain C142) TaxID=1246955 RepID=L0RX85_MYCC1|nr:Hypothetical protein MCYN_0403 [Mycoplasmopsis cynos C142]
MTFRKAQYNSLWRNKKKLTSFRARVSWFSKYFINYLKLIKSRKYFEGLYLIIRFWGTTCSCFVNLLIIVRWGLTTVEKIPKCDNLTESSIKSCSFNTKSIVSSTSLTCFGDRLSVSSVISATWATKSFFVIIFSYELFYYDNYNLFFHIVK